MKHLGDITKINGYTAPPVNVVIGGSPCQDLSVAGKRAGLHGERSGLFMEQIRIIKEMRDNDERQGRTGADIRPRYMVWENVPGAFSSNKGADFGAVLQETVKVIEKVGTLDCMHDKKAIIELSNGIVRRLTPLEYERLQGYPDGWTAIGEIVGYNVYTDEEGNEYKDPIREYTDGNGKRKKVTDSARYSCTESISIYKLRDVGVITWLTTNSAPAASISRNRLTTAAERTENTGCAGMV